MIDINKISELNKQLDQIERRKELVNRMNTISFSRFNPLRESIDETALLHFRDISRSSAYIESLRFAEKSIKQTYLENVRSFQNYSVENLKKIVDEVFRPFSTSNLINPRIKEDFEQLRKTLISPVHPYNSEPFKSLEQIKRATALSSFEAISKTLSDQTNLLGNENFLRQISRSFLSYDHFTNNTLAMLNNDLNKSVFSALKGSLTIANEQVLRTTSAVQSYIENSITTQFDKANSFYDREFPRINRYRVQRQELLKRSDIDENEDYESLLIKSPSAISYEQISNCMTLIGLCNEASETINSNSIFTITSTLWLSSWKLIDVVPTNKDSFAIIVDCLYLMLYEGAGKDKLRFIEQGYINSDEAEIIWKIKHLRNKWLRHDINHGKESDIKKSHQHRKEAFEWFGLGKVPYSKDEFIFLYNNLIIKVEEFLKLLLERVSTFSK